MPTQSMEINLNTPALLFPAVSLLLLAYTNRFLALANLIRNLHSQYQSNPDRLIIQQIANLRRRVHLIKNMQILGVSSILLCTVCMFVLFAGAVELGQYIFGASLLLLILSLTLSIMEIRISINALNLQLEDLEDQA